MKLTFPFKFLTLIAVIGSSSFVSPMAKAGQFGETALDQTQVIAIARPYGEGKYDLLVIEQIPKKKQCWSESGSNPVMVTPLLLNFDFTGHCRRSTDSNGYSVRIDGTDYGLDYLLRVVPRGSELMLVGTPRNPKLPELIIGETQGMNAGFMKIILNPGWQFTKRTYNGKPLGHFYFSGSQANITITPSNSAPAQPSPSVEPVIPTPPPSSNVEPVVPVPDPPINPTVPPVTPPPTPSSSLPAPTLNQTNTSPPPKKGIPSVDKFRQPY
jgi:hypothetical protein